MQAKKIKFLSKKKVEKIREIIERNYGAGINLSENCLVETSEGKIWILSKQLAQVNISRLRVNAVGLYFGRVVDDKIRLSIEGCQLVGPLAKKNVVILNKDSAESFVRGKDVKVEEAISCEDGNFALVKYGDDFLGCGKFSKGHVENLIPKSRRIYVAEVPESG